MVYIGTQVPQTVEDALLDAGSVRRPEGSVCSLPFFATELRQLKAGANSDTDDTQ
jgi:hypothetical protein